MYIKYILEFQTEVIYEHCKLWANRMLLRIDIAKKYIFFKLIKIFKSIITKCSLSEFQAAGHGMEKLLSVAQRESLIIENRNVHIEPATIANMVLDP